MDKQVRVKFRLDGRPLILKSLSLNCTLSQIRTELKEIQPTHKFTEMFSENEYFPISIIDEKIVKLHEILINGNEIALVNQSNSAEIVPIPNEPKTFVRFYLNDKPFLSQKVNLNNTLELIRQELSLAKDQKFLDEGFPISEEDESLIRLSEIQSNNDIYLIKRLDSPPNNPKEIRNEAQANPADNQNNGQKKNRFQQEDVNYEHEQELNEYQNEAKEQNQNFFFNLIKKSKFISEKNGIKTYLYPQIKLNPNEKAESKTLIVLGQTGSGKTTLLNSLLNYILGVKLEDPFRFVLINENTGKSQAESQTSEVTLYQIKGTNTSPPLNIVDTPGFGDTRGLQQDQKIIDMIRHFFTKQIDPIEVLHVVCFVAQSSLPRLTLNQKYIFARIMEIFGEDVAENFVAMLTFCDGGDPNILEALQDKKESSFAELIPKIMDPWYLKFNNSAIFSTKTDDKLRKFFWDIAMEGFKDFMDKKLMKNYPRSLILTKEVLSERKKLEETLACLRPELDKALAVKESIRQNILIVERNRDQMEANKNFKITTTIQKPNKKSLPPGIHTTTCRDCNRTCHNNCAYPSDSDKAKCCAMNPDGYCNVCPKKCYWEMHSNVPYVIEFVDQTETTTAQDLYRKYHDAQSTKNSTEQILDGLTKEFLQMTLQCLQLQSIIKDAVDRLRGIALKKNVAESVSEYIDLMIQSEKDEKKPGYHERIQGLNDMKIQYDLLKQICRNDKNSSFSQILKEAELLASGSNKSYAPKQKGKIQEFLEALKKFI